MTLQALRRTTEGFRGWLAGVKPAPVVRSSSKLDYKDLTDLFKGVIIALRVPFYVDRLVCKQVADKLLTNEIKDYSNAPGIGRIGMAYYEAMTEADRKEYYSRAYNDIQKLRTEFAPYLSPIDKFRLELQELWPKGSHVQNLGRGNMFVGLSRAIDEGKDILPHEDVLRRDDRSVADCRNVVAQIAMNVYLKMPKNGGELELWDHACKDEEFDALRGDSYGIERNKLPPPIVRLKPSEGELVLFNSTKLHAVCPVDGGKRLSVSCFVAYRGNKSPLTLWS